MILIESTPMGYTYIDDEGNYFATVAGHFPNDPHTHYPMALGPWELFDEDDFPF